ALGAIVSADGYILTKGSELRGELGCKLSDGTSYDAAYVGYHKATDLALIKIDAAGLKPVKFADAEVAVVGNWVATPGIGLDVAGVGVVSHGVRNLTGTEATDMNNANRGFLGVTLVTTDTGDGALIRSVEATAARAGLKMNDLICEVAGKTVKDS